jgi:hypothetical protein
VIAELVGEHPSLLLEYVRQRNVAPAAMKPPARHPLKATNVTELVFAEIDASLGRQKLGVDAIANFSVKWR